MNYTAYDMTLCMDIKNKLSTRRHGGHGENALLNAVFSLCSSRKERGYTEATEKAWRSAAEKISVFSVPPCFKKNDERGNTVFIFNFQFSIFNSLSVLWKRKEKY
jgi:hypothetical protein